MRARRTKKASNPAVAEPRRDAGVSFIELLVAIVLLGTAVIAVLVGLRTSIFASAVERDHARSQQWLQSASELLLSSPWLDCDTSTPSQLSTDYQTLLQSDSTIRPAGWSDANQISVPVDVRLAAPDASYGSVCFPEIDRQLITVQVTDPDGQILETVEVVKDR